MPGDKNFCPPLPSASTSIRVSEVEKFRKGLLKSLENTVIASIVTKGNLVHRMFPDLMHRVHMKKKNMHPDEFIWAHLACIERSCGLLSSYTV